MFRVCAILFFIVYHDIFSCHVIKQIRTGGLCNMNFIWPRKNSYCPRLRLGQYEFFLGHIKFILHSPPVRICILLTSTEVHNFILKCFWWFSIHLTFAFEYICQQNPYCPLVAICSKASLSGRRQWFLKTLSKAAMFYLKKLKVCLFMQYCYVNCA